MADVGWYEMSNSRTVLFGWDTPSTKEGHGVNVLGDSIY